MKTHKKTIFLNVYTCLQGFNIGTSTGSILILYRFFVYWFIICIFASWLWSQKKQLKNIKPFILFVNLRPCKFYSGLF